jgi:nucleotide-binding universal stress UspA family protein
MPTHGYGTFRRFLIGSVTAKVLDDLAGPVLTGVHMERHAHDLQEEFKSVACAIDLEQSSAETLLTAASFAHDFGAKLAVVHVRPSTGPGSSATTADLKPQLEELVEAELTKHQLHFEPGRFMVCVQTGEISRTICDFAERQGAGLLVIGREHKGQQGGRLQTHTYSIIRQSACPVLSV